MYMDFDTQVCGTGQTVSDGTAVASTHYLDLGVALKPTDMQWIVKASALVAGAADGTLLVTVEAATDTGFTSPIEVARRSYAYGAGHATGHAGKALLHIHCPAMPGYRYYRLKFDLGGTSTIGGVFVASVIVGRQDSIDNLSDKH